MAEESDDGSERVTNKANALGQKLEFELRNGFRTTNHYQFQGGILEYHQWVTLFVGHALITVAFVLQEGAWIYFYFIGAVKILKDFIREIMSAVDSTAVNTKPLTYYLIGALLTTIIMTQAGYTVPDMKLGLIANSLEALP